MIADIMNLAMATGGLRGLRMLTEGLLLNTLVHGLNKRRELEGTCEMGANWRRLLSF
jgi:hypothetical protein